MIEIKHLDGTRVVKMEIPTGSSVHRELMGEHYVKIPFSTDSPIYFRLGDFCIISGFGRFELTKQYAPKYNAATGGYDYSLQLDAYYIKWGSKVCRYIPENAASETSFHLTADVRAHLGVIVSNINALGSKDSNFKYEGQNYTYVLTNFTADDDNAKYFQYNNTDIISALNGLAALYECEWWVEDNVIHFGRCEQSGEAVDFEINVNVESMSGSESKNEYANRLFAFGSERNLPSNYRREESADITINGVVQKRLMLPLSLCPNGYVQDTGVTRETEAVEGVIVNDEIYPHVNCHISRIESYQKTSTNEDTGEEVTRTFYRLYDDSGFEFSSEYILEGKTLHIQFTSGRLNGMDFECQYNDDEEYYEVVGNEDYGRFLPDESLKPAVGDYFVLYNWDATRISETGIIEAAEMELYDFIVEKLAKTKIDPNTYQCVMDSVVYENDMKTVPDTYAHYDLGQKVTLINSGCFEIPRVSRIIGYDIKLDIEYDTPEYLVGEATVYSTSENLQEQIDAITFNGQRYERSGGEGSIYIITTTSQIPSSDSNVYSAKRSDRQFVRKDVDDSVRGQLTFEKEDVHNKGSQFGEQFISGITGVGGRIDEDGNGELNSLSLRKWLDVPELRYNRVSIYTGIRWDTFGGGIIESVTPNPAGAWTGTGKLKLDAGEIGAIAVGDLCMGIWHDETGNDTENSDDNRGNFTFAGFKTVYFVITGVSGTHNENFTYTLRSQAEGGNGVHPFAQMHFAGRGSTSDTSRQAFTYTTTEYSLSLKGVSTWEFQPSNYYEIRGHIEGFSMPAIDHEGHPYTKVFHGYGQVFGNAYVFGDIDQFERAGYTMLIDQSLNGSLAPGETEQVTIKILDGYGLDCTTQFSQISVTRDTGDAASDAIWNARHTQVDNPFDISFSDLGIDGINRMLAVFHVVATDEADDMSVSGNMDFFS